MASCEPSGYGILSFLHSAGPHAYTIPSSIYVIHRFDTPSKSLARAPSSPKTETSLHRLHPPLPRSRFRFGVHSSHPVIDTCIGVAPTPPHRARTYKPRFLALPPGQHQDSNNGDGRRGRVDGAVRRGEMIVFKCRRVMILPMLIFVWECHSKTPAKGMAARAHALTLGLL